MIICYLFEKNTISILLIVVFLSFSPDYIFNIFKAFGLIEKKKMISFPNNTCPSVLKKSTSLVFDVKMPCRVMKIYYLYLKQNANFQEKKTTNKSLSVV